MGFNLPTIPSFSCSPTNYFGLPSTELLLFVPDLWEFAFSKYYSEPFVLEPFTIPLPKSPLRRLIKFGILGRGGQATVHMVYLEGRYAALKVVKRSEHSPTANESNLNKYIKEIGAEDHHVAAFDEAWSSPSRNCFLMVRIQRLSNYRSELTFLPHSPSMPVLCGT